MNKKEKARLVTIKIFRIILEDFNGYTKEEILEKEMAEECEGSEYWGRIEEIIMKNLTSNSLPTNKEIEKEAEFYITHLDFSNNTTLSEKGKKKMSEFSKQDFIAGAKHVIRLIKK